MNLDRRLSAAADMVPRGARLADIGSDHAYLPIALCLDGKIEYALASDINDGPVASAISNVRANGLLDKISVVRADGLDLARDFAPDCISVLGMGGELIVSILDAARWIRDERITLVLQPMTHAEIVARYLADNGFYIKDEKIVKDGERSGKLYRIMCAGYDGIARRISEADAYIGAINLDRGDAETLLYIDKTVRSLSVRIEGKKRAGEDTPCEQRLYDELCAYLGK
jgi:tRNA (adenine22-N1)-methyltransferase